VIGPQGQGQPGPAGSADRAAPAVRGTARERTALAWNRSSLALIVCVAALVRHLWPIEGDGELIALGAIAGAGALWVVVLFTLTTTNAGLHEEALVGERVFRLMTIGTLFLAVAGFVLAFFGPT
jgi:hypothetical protein